MGACLPCGSERPSCMLVCACVCILMHPNVPHMHHMHMYAGVLVLMRLGACVPAYHAHIQKNGAYRRLVLSRAACAFCLVHKNNAYTAECNHIGVALVYIYPFTGTVDEHIMLTHRNGLCEYASRRLCMCMHVSMHVYACVRA
jgi:hypothetical protein